MYPKNRPLPPEAANRVVQPSNRRESEREDSEVMAMNVTNTLREPSSTRIGCLKGQGSDSSSTEQILQQTKLSRLPSRVLFNVQLAPTYPQSADEIPEYGSNNSDATFNTDHSPVVLMPPSENAPYNKGMHMYMPSHPLPPAYDENTLRLAGAADERVQEFMNGRCACLNAPSFSQPPFVPGGISDEEMVSVGYNSNGNMEPLVPHHPTRSFSYQQHDHNSHHCPSTSCFPPFCFVSRPWQPNENSVFDSRLPVHNNQRNGTGYSQLKQQGQSKKFKNGLNVAFQKDGLCSTGLSDKEALLQSKDDNGVFFVKKNGKVSGKKDKNGVYNSFSSTRNQTISNAADADIVFTFEEPEQKEQKKTQKEQQEGFSSALEESTKYILKQHEHDVNFFMRVIVGLLKRISSIKAATHSIGSTNDAGTVRNSVCPSLVDCDADTIVAASAQKEGIGEVTDFKEQLSELQNILKTMEMGEVTEKQNSSALLEGILAISQLLPLSAVSTAALGKLTASISNHNLVPENELILARGMHTEVKALMKTLDFETSRPIFLNLVVAPPLKSADTEKSDD